MGRYRKRLSLQAIAEEFSVGALKHAADRGAQFEHSRRDLLVQALLVKHRGQKTDRDHNECLILRRPHRNRQTIDVRTPQSAGNNIAMFA